MKKSILKIAGLLAISASLFLASCSTDASNFSSQTDTVLNLAAPQVKATAYPGMNYISWKPVANANGYVIYIYEDGHFVKATDLAYDVLNFVDTEIVNGSKYTYYIEATSKTSSGRAVVTENTMSEAVSVTAIVPSYNVKSLELVNYENPKGNTEFVVNSSNLHIANDGFGKISISFPAKAYLNYYVSYTKGNTYESTGNPFETMPLDVSDKARNDVILYVDDYITSAGTYRAALVAQAENSHFGVSKEIVSEETVVINVLDGDGAEIVSAGYKDLGKTVRVVFDKFTLADGTDAPASYYKVYRAVAGTSKYSPASGTVKPTDNTKATYFVDDVIEDNTIKYEYIVVVTDGENYSGNPDTENVAPYTNNVAAAATISGNASIEDADGIANDIEWTITVPSSDVKIEGVYVFEKSVTDTADVVAGDFDTTNAVAYSAATDDTNTTFKAFTKNHTFGNNVYMLVVTSEKDKVNTEVVSLPVEVLQYSISTPLITVEVYDNTVTGATTSTPTYDDVIINVDDDIYEVENIADYTYTLYKAKSTVKSDISTITWTFDTKDWEKVETLQMKKNEVSADPTLYTAVVKISDLEDGVYGYKVVKTDKFGNSKVAIDYASITADSVSISYKPVISASWINFANAVSDVKVTFVKDTPAPTEIIETSGTLSGLVVGMEEVKQEEGVEYSLYRRVTSVKSNPVTEIVWEKVNGSFGTTNTTEDATVYYDNAGTPTAKTIKYVKSITYTLTDKNLSTGNGYDYIVVAEKTGAEPKYSNIDSVLGAN
ncbi:MAG: hypothetical protein J6J67_03090 [Treponema sp.]|nr:hypothetical protein [Treponema sp.]